MLLPIQSMGQAVTTFVGQNLGAKKLERAKKGTLEAFFLTLGISAAVAMILWTFAAPLMRLFIQDDETIYYGTLFIHVCVPFAVLCCFNQIFSGALRGAGRSQVPMVITLCTHVLFRQLYLAVITRVLPGNVYAVGFGYPVGWILCAAVITLYYRFSHWERNA